MGIRDNAEAKILEFDEESKDAASKTCTDVAVKPCTDVAIKACTDVAIKPCTDVVLKPCTKVSNVVKRKRDSVNCEEEINETAAVVTEPAAVKKVKVATPETKKSALTNGLTNGVH